MDDITQSERASKDGTGAPVDSTESADMDMGSSDEESSKNIDRSDTRDDQVDDYSSRRQHSRDRTHDTKGDHRNGNRHEHRVSKSETNMIQVINVSPFATSEQLTTLFSFLGKITNIKLYVSDQSADTNFKVCFVEFAKPSSVLLAQHLTNIVFIDRALIVLPYYSKHEIPDKETALADVSGSKYLTNFNSGVVSQVITSPGGIQMIATIDPRLTALGLTQYPQLPINTDPTRIEEIRRTVYIGNLDSTISPDEVMKFFNDIGEVKYIRMAGDDTQPTRFAFVEFAHQSSIANALQHHGFVLGSRSLKINHSNNAIVKPQPKIEVNENSSKRLRDNRSGSISRNEYSSRDGHISSRYDRERVKDRERDRYYDRRGSPITSQKSRSRDRDISSRGTIRSRDRRRSPRREKSSRSRRSRSRDSRRRRSRSRSSERSRSSKRQKSSRR